MHKLTTLVLAPALSIIVCVLAVSGCGSSSSSTTAQSARQNPVTTSTSATTPSTVTATGKIGYLTFNSHNGPAEKQLYDAITTFKNAAVNDLVIDMRYNGGLYVSSGDVDGDGKADVITGAGGSANVSVFSGATGAQLESYFAYDPAFTGGARVAAVDRNHDGKADIISVAGPGGGPDVRTVDGGSLHQLDQFFAYSPLFSGGLYVAAGE